MKPWVARAYRAHLNLIEQFLPFAVVVLIGEVRGASSPWLGALAAAFFTLRVAHAFGMISGRARMPLRPIIFSVAYLVVIAYAALLAVV
ncbi:MAG: MAPEG family protein [Myxococcota bacterium]